MLALRPTFSESWYRVANLRARLRPSAQISRQFYRGERWYVVRDPAGNQYHRLSDPAYRVVALLDGKRTIQEAWDLAGGQLADDAPTQPEVIQILSQLYAANLIEADITPDSGVLLRRHKTLMKRKMQGRLMNIMFPRIPLWDCDQFLVRWLPVVRPFISKFGAMLWIAVVGLAVILLAPHWNELKSSAVNAIAPKYWFLLWGVFVLTKLIHELGHAFACRRFGGEVHEMGIMFLVLIPTPYVDASSAWGFPSRWQRMFVGAAGMVIEIFVAALCALLWLQVGDKSSTVGVMLYQAMLIASVSTVLFNANPLLRYDGYYMLSDWWEIPNLQKRSTEYTLGLIKRHVFRIKERFPLPPPLQRFNLFLYANLSTVYRVFIGLMIIILLLNQLPEQVKIVGVLLGTASIVTWLLLPVFKLVKYLALDPELHRKRGRATAFSVAVAALLFVLIGMVPVWNRVLATGVVEPENRAVIFASMDGFVTSVHVKDGQAVTRGQVLIEAENPELATYIEQLKARIKATEAQLVKSSAFDQAQRKVDEIELANHKRELANAEKKLSELTIRAPIDGRVVAPKIHELPGQYLQRGQELCKVATLDRLVIKAPLEPEIGQLVQWELEMKREVPTEVRLSGAPLKVLRGVPEVLPAASEELVSPVLTHQAGGDIAPDPRDPEGRTAAQKQLPLRVIVENPDGEFLPGQRATVRLELSKRTIFEMARDKIYQVIMNSRSG
jgi:putative peptide zinc metalloprotease protein